MGEGNSWVQQPLPPNHQQPTLKACGVWCPDPGDIRQGGKQAHVVRAFNFSKLAVNLDVEVVSSFFKGLETLADFQNGLRGANMPGLRAGWGLGLPAAVPWCGSRSVTI